MSRTATSGQFEHRKSGRAQASVSGVVWSFGNVAVSTVLTLAVFLVTSRVLSPEDFGAVALATAIVTILATLVPSAFGDALVQRKRLRRAHLDTIFWLTLCLGVLAFAALWLATPFLAAWTAVDPLAGILPVLALRLVFDAALTVPASLIARRMQFRTVALRSMLANALGAAVCLWLVLQGYALWALVLSQLVNSAAALLISATAAGYRPRLVFRRRALSELARFGLFSMGSRMLNEARVDQFILGLFLGAPVLGLYYFARRLFTLLRDGSAGVFGPITNVLIASLNGEAEKRRTAYFIASFGSAAISLPLFAGLMATAPQAVPLVFGVQWTEAVFALQCFSVLGMFAGVSVIQSALICSMGQPDWWFRFHGFLQASALPVIVVAAPYGLDAIMIGLVLRTLLIWPFALRKTARLLDVPMSRYLLNLSGPFLGSAALIPFVLQVPAVLAQAHPAMILAVQVGIGAAVYIAMLLALSGPQLRDIRRRFGRGVTGAVPGDLRT